MKRFPVIIGPTAGGKSALALDIAGRVPAEIVSADSVQVYRGMDIGSAKPSPEERARVPHHLIDIADPRESFTVHEFLARAGAAIDDIRSRGKLPILVGGTHLYIKAFLDGLFEGPAGDESLRAELRAFGRPRLREELLRIDPAAAARIHANDERRTIRALEVHRLTGVPISDLQKQWDREDHRRKDCFLVALWWPAERINPRINARVREMMSRGLVEEARALFDADAFGTQSREALGYRQLIAHFQGRCSLDEAVEQIKIETRRFAKNQRTWLRRLRATPGCVWIDAGTTSDSDRARIVLDALGA